MKVFRQIITFHTTVDNELEDGELDILCDRLEEEMDNFVEQLKVKYPFYIVTNV